MASFAVKALDHVVLTCKHIPKTIDFYTTRLGMKHEMFGPAEQQRHALTFGSQKINLHQSGAEFEPKAQNVQPGSGDLCFTTEHPIEKVLTTWQAAGVEVKQPLVSSSLFPRRIAVKEDVGLKLITQVLEGGKVVDRTGAVGRLRSVYCRDPDGNLIEYVDPHFP
ncbi:hypothetical protein D0867_01424 [Hortaea werneckii]|uniref:VOC domain-containing protein n=1 Tax=Hortaea werneckii TaxID=91943 RepID=A0A3M7AAA7_HORWE|nr:hypothetical protein D0867_01424 [Hortaea werneckii]